MDALSLIDPSGATTGHSALVEHLVESNRAYEQWQQGTLDNDGLLQVLRETNDAFASSSIGKLQDNDFSYRFNKHTLPPELRGRYEGRTDTQGYDYNHSSWSVSRSFRSLPGSFIARQVERFLSVLDTRAEPMRVVRADAELYFDSNTVVPDFRISNLSTWRSHTTLNALQQQVLANQLQIVDSLLEQAGMQSRILLNSTSIYIDASLIPGYSHLSGTMISYQLANAPLQAVADHLLADALALGQSDEGRQQMLDIHHALNSLAPDKRRCCKRRNCSNLCTAEFGNPAQFCRS